MMKPGISRSPETKTIAFTAALAGNPNAGKTSLFNALTGRNEGVGNWPGKTVERRVGVCRRNGFAFNVVDLPGAYSLTAFSPDEAITRSGLMGGELEAIINVVDAANLERNLYLTIELLETGIPVVVALNMVDVATDRGVQIDRELLAELLGAPVVPLVASRKQGIDNLINAVLPARQGGKNRAPFRLAYSPDVEEALAEIERALHGMGLPAHSARWTALQLLEHEPNMLAWARSAPEGEALVELAHSHAERLRMLNGDDVDIIAADQRYSLVRSVSRQVVSRSKSAGRSATDRIDDVVTHRLLGLPIFLAVMYLVFMLVVDVSAPFLDWVDSVINGPVVALAESIMTAISAPAWLQSLLVDGIIAGVGGVLVFVPGLLALFFFLALLEDTGYLARAAFVMDRLMRVIGLHGKAVIPLLLGFGCAIPAIYATRTIPSRRDRVLTALLIPLMSCSARLPVYIVFGIAFFGRYAGQVIWLLYALGILIAIAAGLIFTRTILRADDSTAFVLELPPYQLPTVRGLGSHVWENTIDFLRKAGTLIATLAIILWLLLNLPLGVTETRQSYFGRFSAALAPVFAPLGFGTWEVSGSLVSGFVAKEVVVSSLSQIYAIDQPVDDAPVVAPVADQLSSAAVGLFSAVGDAGRRLISLIPGINLTGNESQVEDTLLSATLRGRFTPLAAFSFLVFVLLYTPCIATIGAIKQEFGWPWAITAAGYQTLLAWIIAFIVFQGGRMLGFA